MTVIRIQKENANKMEHCKNNPQTTTACVLLECQQNLERLDRACSHMSRHMTRVVSRPSAPHGLKESLTTIGMLSAATRRWLPRSSSSLTFATESPSVCYCQSMILRTNMTLVERQSRGVLRSCVGRHGNPDTQCEVKWINRIREAEVGQDRGLGSSLEHSEAGQGVLGEEQET